MPDDNATQPDAASILFPNDAPARQDPSFTAVVAERLNRKQTDDKNNEPAQVLFKDDAAASREFDSTETASTFDAQVLSALKEEDPDRADAIRVAEKGLVADAQSAGTSTEDFNAALGVVRERVGGLNLPTPDDMAKEEPV